MTESTVTPAQELRAAAAALRETAKEATPGPWEIRPGNRVSSNVAHYGHLVIDGGGWTDGEKAVVYGAALNTDAAWIALVSPWLAEPLAAWLDLYAEWGEAVYDLPDGRFHDCEERVDNCRCLAPALAVARVLNAPALICPDVSHSPPAGGAGRQAPSEEVPDGR